MTTQPGPKRHTLLIVDDEPQVCDTLRRVLYRHGYEVLTAHSAAQALAVLEAQHVDAIVSDQRMPRETGISLLRTVRDRWPDVVRILLSGAADADEVDGALRDGTVDCFLAKPVLGSKLREQLQQMLSSR